MIDLVFASPRRLPRPKGLNGRVAVLDIAFASTVGTSVSFEKTTRPFIQGLGARLAAWIDHHDHARHVDYQNDDRFFLRTKAFAGGCPELISSALVGRLGPVDTIVCHIDLDGLYCAAKWILGGQEPYPGADADARAVDTRLGTPSSVGRQIDWALRGEARDDELKRIIVAWLTTGQKPGLQQEKIEAAAAGFGAKLAQSQAFANHFAIMDRVAYVDVGACPRKPGTSTSSAAPAPAYDKTELLLLGQARAPISVIRDSGQLTIAAAFDSGWNFVVLDLGGGMPTRVSIPDRPLPELWRLLNGAPAPLGRDAAAVDGGEDA